MRGARACLGLALLGAMACRAAPPVFAVMEEFDRLSDKPLWPGFEPRRVPVALYDGERTYLYRHPSPPSGFAPVPGHDGWFAYSGRHESMRANTSAEVGGQVTATLMLDAKPARPARDTAAVLIHECFHVYQHERYPAWAANEAVLFTYPVEDAAALALARMEMAALRRAVTDGAPCWTARFLQLRRERFARIPADAAEYERRNELHEGLAQYVEDVARGRASTAAGEFGPAEVRQRAYVTGAALAALLDRAAPGWKTSVGDSLDGLLPERGEPCDFTAAEYEAASAAARAAVAAIEQRRRDLRREFDAQGGWKVTVEAPGKPLQLAAFDPLNVERLSASEVLHKRWIQLRSAHGSLEILNHGSVTTGAGKHPLMTGVRRWAAAGLPAEPRVAAQGGKVSVTGTWGKVEFEGATLERRGREIVVTLAEE